MTDMGNFLEELKERAKSLSRRVVFPDAADPRTVRAVAALNREGILEPILVGEPGRIREVSDAESVDLDGIVIQDPATSPLHDRLRKALDGSKSGPRPDPSGGIGNPLVFAGMMVKEGLADGCVAGSLSSTADVIRAAIRTVGLRSGCRKVSSYFLMLLPGRILSFADCGVIPDPTAEELAEIATLTADNHRMITGSEPVVAFLSYSTMGSASHPSVEKVRSAASLFRGMRPDIVSDGELQADAAIIPSVSSIKAPGSPVAGRANVLIFPDLGAGNIGYKLTQRLGGATALGPVLQGLARPVFDLSRGCSVDDIVHVSVLNALSAV